MTAPTAVMIFAAGFGTRMGALTADRPKPMIPVAGRPLIDHALDLVSDISPQRVVINTHYKAEVLTTHLEGRDVLISHEEDEILDTVCHEMIHVKQHATKKLIDRIRGGYKKLWKCRDGKYRNYLETAYDKQPWEIEAHRDSGKYMKEFKKEYYGYV